MTTQEETICLCCGETTDGDVCPDCAEELQIIGFELGLDELLRTDALTREQSSCGWCGREVRVNQSFGFKGDVIYHKECLTEIGIWGS